ncbi:MAG: hypothetical protein JWR81_5810, partial [Pseudonocardia sp.]|nr:hypothetical protein [Pseudonocardia sp.]
MKRTLLAASAVALLTLAGCGSAATSAASSTTAAAAPTTAAAAPAGA